MMEFDPNILKELSNKISLYTNTIQIVTLIICAIAAYCSYLSYRKGHMKDNSANLSGYRLHDSAGDRLWIIYTGPAQARNIIITLDNVLLAEHTIFGSEAKAQIGEGRERTILGPQGMHIYPLDPGHANPGNVWNYEKKYPHVIRITWDDDTSSRLFRKPKQREYIGHL